jgi:hypothetical protein
MQPFADLDLTDQYIKHNVVLYAHDHPTEPDGINAGVKAIETALKAFTLPPRAYALSGDGTGALAEGSVTYNPWFESSGILILVVFSHFGLQNGSLLKVTNNTGAVQLDYGVDASTYGGYLTLGSTTYASDVQNLSDLPIVQSVGVVIGSAHCQFFENNYVGASIPVSKVFPTPGATQIELLGAGFSGQVHRVAVRTWGPDCNGADDLLAGPPPAFYGLDSLMNPLVYYDCSQAVEVLTQYGAQIANNAIYTIPVTDGVWVPRAIV